MKKFKPTKFDVMVLGLTALFLLVTGLYFVVCNGAFCPLCQDYFISNGETYIWDTRGGYLGAPVRLPPLSLRRRLHAGHQDRHAQRVLLHRPDGHRPLRG